MHRHQIHLHQLVRHLSAHLVFDFTGVVVDEEGMLELLRHLVKFVIFVLLVELLQKSLICGPRETETQRIRPGSVAILPKFHTKQTGKETLQAKHHTQGENKQGPV